MGRVFLYALTFFMLAMSVYATTCTDTDNGPTDVKDAARFLAVPGTTTDAFKTHEDMCVRSEVSDKKVGESDWLREHYCSGAITKHKGFKCSDFGFEKCVSDDTGSYCKGGKTAAGAQQQPVQAPPPKKLADFYCGEKVMNRKDAECYPPGKLCIKDRSAGECNVDCKCILVGKKESADTTLPEETGAEEQEDEEPEEKEEQKEEVKEEKKEVPKKTSEQKKVKKSGSEKKQPVTLRVVAAVTNTVRKVWQGILGLFS